MAADYEAIRQANLREYGEGTRHLAYLGRLYTDRTHFLFEVLQNAEDAAATQVRFDLSRDCLEMRHDGRPFDERDVRGVCGVGESTKSRDITQIGKFGIGFKSVYAVTDRPQIHSGDEHFEIANYVRPHALPTTQVEEPWTTKLTLPLAHPEVSGEQAFREIGRALATLPAETLLFLRRLARLQWRIADGREGRLERLSEPQEKGRLVTLREAGRADASWIVVERPLAQPEAPRSLRVEAAFRYDGRAVLPVEGSRLVVYFPTEIETHLGFLLQGPYRTTPARDNIPRDEPWNQRLVIESAELVVEAMATLRDMGLLTTGLLEALPLRAMDFPPGSTFRPLYERVRGAFYQEPLLPAFSGGHITAVQAKLARGADLLDLVSDEQLTRLMGQGSPFRWLAADISEHRTVDLYRYLTGRKSSWPGDPNATDPLVPDIELRPDGMIRRLNEVFLGDQTDGWLSRLYALINRTRESWGFVRTLPLLRLEGDRMSPPFDDGGVPQAFLPLPTEESDFPTVKRELAEIPGVRHFLTQLGVAEPDVLDEVLLQVLPKYEGTRQPNPEENRRDLHKVSRALRESHGPERARLINALRRTSFIPARTPSGRESYRRPEEVYQDTPALRLYFAATEATWFLLKAEEHFSEHYEALGITDKPRRITLPADLPEPVKRRLRKSKGWSHDLAITDVELDGLDAYLARLPNLPTAERQSHAKCLWDFLLAHMADHSTSWDRKQIFLGEYRWYHRRPRVADFDSAMLRQLKEAAWLPDRHGAFHRPADLSPQNLSTGIPIDDTLVVILGMRTSALEELARAHHIDPTLLQFALAHPRDIAKLQQRKAPATTVASTEEVRNALQDTFFQPGLAPEEFLAAEPDLATPVPEQRRARIRDEVASARQSEPEAQSHSRRLYSRRDVQKDPLVRSFLLYQYAGRCQVCGNTFRRRIGEAYFEGLYMVPRTLAAWTDRPGNVLCLCPTCCAKFLYGEVAPLDGDPMDLIARFEPNKHGDPTGLRLRLRLCGEDVTLGFTDRHALDLQEIFRAAADVQ